MEMIGDNLIEFISAAVVKYREDAGLEPNTIVINSGKYEQLPAPAGYKWQLMGMNVEYKELPDHVSFYLHQKKDRGDYVMLFYKGEDDDN